MELDRWPTKASAGFGWSISRDLFHSSWLWSSGIKSRYDGTGGLSMAVENDSYLGPNPFNSQNTFFWSRTNLPMALSWSQVSMKFLMKSVKGTVSFFYSCNLRSSSNSLAWESYEYAFERAFQTSSEVVRPTTVPSASSEMVAVIHTLISLSVRVQATKSGFGIMPSLVSFEISTSGAEIVPMMNPSKFWLSINERTWVSHEKICGSEFKRHKVGYIEIRRIGIFWSRSSHFFFNFYLFIIIIIIIIIIIFRLDHFTRVSLKALIP